MFEGDLLEERARITPEKLALVSVESGRRLTYRELNALAEHAAGAIVAAGVQPGDRFGILAHNSIEYVALFFAAGKRGAIVVPLSTRATAHELQGIVADCGMHTIWYGIEFDAVAQSLTVDRKPLTEIEVGSSVNGERLTVNDQRLSAEHSSHGHAARRRSNVQSPYVWPSIQFG